MRLCCGTRISAFCVLGELAKGCQRFMADHGVFISGSESFSSGSDPPLAWAMNAFTGAASRL